MRHSVRARLLMTVVCATCMLALPAAASASKGSPVHIDPASPVAKEYALPLSTARGAPPESGRSGGLFGNGIKHSSSGTPSGHTTTTEVPPAQTETTPPETAPPVTTTATHTTTATQTTTSPRHHQPGHITTVTLPDLVATGTGTRTTADAVPAAYKVLKPGSGSGLLWMVLAAAVVVALGSAGGMALARRR